jgi:opacity protein-like surface antigen
VPTPNCTTTQTGFTINNIGLLAIPAGAASAAIAGAVGSVNSVFLTQQGSAFVSAPANPTPNQPGGGVWARVVGGEADVKSTSVSNGVGTGSVANTAQTTCANATHERFAGAQVGADIARLNWNGWNVHVGTTAGYLGSKENDNNGFSNTLQVPFFGTYLVATHGRFFADLMVREEYYNIALNNQGFNFFNQPVNAHGYSISGSAGYNFDLGNGWFVEPSGGFVYSKTSVDNFISPGATALGTQGLITTNDVESELGRLTVRAGRTIETPTMIWQPFGTASVFHEFAGNVVSNFTTLPNNFFVRGAPETYTQTTSTSRIGTYGQYSLGLAAQVKNTGWLGFVRVDYRDGDNIQGWTGNAGIRYQFTPEMIASVMPVKVKAPPRPFIAPTNWTGFYVGGFAGAAAGRTDIGFVGDPVNGNRPWVMGGLGGLEAGYNYQFANKWVVGVEGDIAGANIHGGRPAGIANGLDANGNNTGAFTPAFYTLQDHTNWQATLAGRLGYAWERTLFYVKGGVAFEDSNTTVNCIFGPGPGLPLNDANGNPRVPPAFRTCNNPAGAVTPAFSTPSYTRVGGIVGFGTEFDLGHNWSAKSEYDFMSFDRHTATATDGTVMTDKSWISRVTVGVNYKFTPGAVVAKY